MSRRTYWVYKVAGDGEKYSISPYKMTDEARPVRLSDNEYGRINAFWDYDGIQRWLAVQYKNAGKGEE